MNDNIKVTAYNEQIQSNNALEIIKNYDIVVDATDNVATRYLLNDACVLCKKPLVSGSALQFEGQLTVYNYDDGPCYRCIFPKPPPPEAVNNCGDSGVLGTGEYRLQFIKQIACSKISSFVYSHSLRFKSIIFHLNYKSKFKSIIFGYRNSINIKSHCKEESKKSK